MNSVLDSVSRESTVSNYFYPKVIIKHLSKQKINCRFKPDFPLRTKDIRKRAQTGWMSTILFVASVLSVFWIFTKFLRITRKKSALSLFHTKINEESHIKLIVAFQNNNQFLLILQCFLFIPFLLMLVNILRFLNSMP